MTNPPNNGTPQQDPNNRQPRGGRDHTPPQGGVTNIYNYSAPHVAPPQPQPVHVAAPAQAAHADAHATGYGARTATTLSGTTLALSALVGALILLAFIYVIIPMIQKSQDGETASGKPLINLAPKTSADLADSMESNILKSASDAAATKAAAESEKLRADTSLAKVDQYGYKFASNQGQLVVTPLATVAPVSPPTSIVVNLPPVAPASPAQTQLAGGPATSVTAPPPAASLSIVPGSGATLTGGTVKRYQANAQGQLVPAN